MFELIQTISAGGADKSPQKNTFIQLTKLLYDLNSIYVFFSFLFIYLFI